MKKMKHRTKGFTVVEITIASAILAIMVLMVYNFMKPGMDTTQSGNKSISDLSNMNLFMDYLKVDVRTCAKFKAISGPPADKYQMVCLKDFSGTPEEIAIEYVIEEHQITRNEKSTAGAVIKSKNFPFTGVIEFEMAKSTSYDNMIKITKLVLKRQKGGKFINLFASTASTVANQIGLKSFYPVIYDL